MMMILRRIWMIYSKYVIVLICLCVCSCKQDTGRVSLSQSNEYPKYASLYYDNGQISTMTFTNNNEPNGFFIRYSESGNKLYEGIVITKEKYVKKITYSYLTNDFSWKIYIKKKDSAKRILQQTIFFDSGLNKIDTLGNYLSIVNHEKSFNKVTYDFWYCPIDSLVITDKSNKKYRSYLIEDDLVVVDLPEVSLTTNFILDYYCKYIPGEGIATGRIMFNAGFAMFKDSDYEILRTLKEVRDNSDISDFFMSDVSSQMMEEVMDKIGTVTKRVWEIPSKNTNR